MSELRVNFLNWRPDQEPLGNDGLVTADNVVHDAEGYRPIHLTSAGGFQTTGGLTTITSIVTKDVGSGTDKMSAWLSGTTLHVGLNGDTATTSSTGYPLSFATAVGNAAIVFFDVCEIEDRVFFVARAEGDTLTPSTAVSIGMCGYMDL